MLLLEAMLGRPLQLFFVLKLFLLLIEQGKTITVFNFEDSKSLPELSFASLVNTPSLDLPAKFLICSSHVQSKIYDKNFYVLYGDNGLPWFSISIWEVSNEITLWADLQYGLWYQIAIVEKPWTNFWLHICIHIDTESGKLVASINGNSASKSSVPELQSSKPMRLNMTVGLVDHSWLTKQQFPDSVTNINIFYPSALRNLEVMSSNPCLYAAEGDFMAWHRMTWDMTGEGLKKMNLTEDTICEQEPFYKVPLPTEMSWSDTRQACSNLGHANITELDTQTELDRFVLWFDREHGPCQDIWTPFTDETSEGKFVSANSGKIATFLPWMKGQPNGGDFQNHLAIRRDNSDNVGYHDAKSGNLFCGSCTLHKTTVFTLWGRCEFTFLDSSYVLISTEGHIQYSGIFSTNIW